MSLLQEIAPLIAPVAGAAYAGFKSFKFIHEGEKGIVLRFGKARRKKNNEPKVIEPGFVFIVPFVDTLRRHHVREQTAKLGKQKIFIADDLVMDVGSVVRYKVTDIYKALFNIEELDDSVVDFAKGALNDVVKSKSHVDLRDTKAISSEILKELKEIEEKWGIEIIDFKITSISPDSNSAKILATKKEIEVKVEALIAANGKGIKESGILSALAGSQPVVDTGNDKPIKLEVK